MPAFLPSFAKELALPLAFSEVRDRFPHLDPADAAALTEWLAGVMVETVGTYFRLWDPRTGTTPDEASRPTGELTCKS